MTNRQRARPGIELIPYETICAAVTGDAIAMYSVLNHFHRYICKLCQFPYMTPNGSARRYLDVELMRELEIELLLAILKFKIE